MQAADSVPGLSYFTPSPERVNANIAWLNVYVILVIVLWIISMVFASSRFTDRFDGSGSLKNYLGDQSAAVGAFNSLRDSFTGAQTPYPYGVDCAEVSAAWNYVLGRAKINNPTVESDPLYFGWSALYLNYLKLKNLADATEDSVSQNEVNNAWMAVSDYQKLNSFDPVNSKTPFTRALESEKKVTVSEYTHMATAAKLGPEMEGYAAQAIPYSFPAKSRFADAPTMRDRFADAPTMRDRFATRAIPYESFSEPRALDQYAFSDAGSGLSSATRAFIGAAGPIPDSTFQSTLY
jgi:hypothetical protein